MSAEFEYAMQQKKNGNIDEAKLYFEKAGDNGYTEAYIELAKLAIPEGGEPYYNFSKLDVTRAMVYVGIAYKQGYPVNRNYDMAFNCFAKAVELGDDYLASFYLAECYEKGSGVEADENAAVMYYTMSAECGNIPSMLALARIYKEGLGSIEKDEQKSAKYLFMSGVGRD